MKTLFIAVVAACFSAGVAPAGQGIAPVSGLVLGGQELGHGGGCRKSSPPGQCCHAGSKPYHCH
ncbi:MAG: hypothetical protein ACRBBV_02090 [Paracoccaceae bacterium]